MKRFFLRTLLVLGIVLIVFIGYIIYVYFNTNTISKGVAIQQYKNPNTALLVIDIQEGITGKYSVYKAHADQAPAFIKSVNKVILMADSLRVPVIYIQQQTENWLLNWNDDYVLAIGARGVALDQRMEIVSENIFTKPISDAFSNPELEEFLIEDQISKLLVTGLDIAGCAFNTSMAAKNRGYEVIVIEDAVISKNQELKEEKLIELKNEGIRITNSESVIELLQSTN